jgi:hypothetical protein
VREVRTLVKSFGELATEITVAWIKAKGEASNEPTGVPDIDVVKEFYDTIFDTIQESYNNNMLINPEWISTCSNRSLSTPLYRRPYGTSGSPRTTWMTW